MCSFYSDIVIKVHLILFAILQFSVQQRFLPGERGHTNVAIIKKLSHKISSWYTHEYTHWGEAIPM